MQLPISDLDFYERKIARLESDIATLHGELNSARTRLRSAEDYQIKYQLLLRQSNQQNQRLKMIEEAERSRFAVLLQEQIEKIKEECQKDINERQKKVRNDYQDEIEELRHHIKQLGEKNMQLAQKSEQVDELLLKNKKIVKDLQSLEETLIQNKQKNEQQKQNDLKVLRETLTKKFTDKLAQQKSYYEKKITDLQNYNETLERQIQKIELSHSRNQEKMGGPSEKDNKVPLAIMDEVQKCKKELENKHDEMDKILTERISNEKILMEEAKALKEYIGELEQKIFELQKDQSVELLNLKNRMNEIKEKQAENMRKRLEERQQLFEKQKIKLQFQLEEALENLKFSQEKSEKDLHILHEKLEKANQKISELQEKIKNFQYEREMGETQNLIHSLRQFDNREDQNSSYENGITFLERQLRRGAIKLEQKTIEIKQCVTELNEVRAQCERQIVELKQKYYQESKELQKKIFELEDQVRDLNNEIRKREKLHKERENQLQAYITKANAESRSLRTLNNDLQRDYNRVLESKKTIEKSFREEREKSVTSKSQIAVAKKNKWLQLERQKNEIEIIYKEKEEQMKTKNEIDKNNLRIECDKLKQELELLKDQHQRLKANPSRNNEKENLTTEYNKKIAAINLEIALTQNLYKTLIEARSKTRIHHPEQISERKEEEEDSDIRNRFPDPDSFKINDSVASQIKQREDQPVSQGDCATPYFTNDMMISFKPQK